ncbi:bacterioferritin [Maricaulis sp.]|jgi:bacterioferritin|uniref:bacterioferritin n=1 Tax=Maricaulis sp. TaxID=1486257 RepID=UPI00262FEEF9|nr:bacterioferritin [Maricaulis sp.]
MKGDAKVIEYLNQALKLELAAVNQYFLHARMFKDWGFGKIAKVEYDESIDEMKHADALIERVLFLEGLPNVQDLAKIYIGETLKECLECDLKLEKRAHPFYVEAIAYCEEVQDYVSRKLLTDILDSEEEHIDFLETQLELIGKIGEERYMQSQMVTEE